MKFTDGMWHVREGVDINWMSHVERYHVEDKQAKLLLTKPVRGRADKLNTPTLTLTIASPREGIIAANFVHWDGEEDQGPCFPLSEDDSNLGVHDDDGKALVFKTGPLDAWVDTKPNSLSLQYSIQGKKLTGHGWRSIAYVADKRTPKYRPSDELYVEREPYILLELDVSVNEKIYGLGERFGPFVKNGQSIDIWNEDGGTSSEQTYKNIPFYISSRGYGVFFNHPGRVMLEIQSERTTRVNIAVKGERLEYIIIAGPNVKDILRRYTALTGRPSLPPAWSYGLWLTTSFTTSYDESTVTSFLDGLKERSIPLSVFHFDAYWMKSYQWCDFTFDSDTFPNPESYLKSLKTDRNLRLSVWLNPYVAQSSPLFAEGKKNKYFILRADTSTPTVYQTDLWQPGMAIVDFTNPAACTWFSSHLRSLLALGIDSFKTDFGERIPFLPNTVKYHNNADPLRMHNLYTYIYNRTVHNTMTSYFNEHNLPNHPILFSRSATTGSQKYPIHWAGDSESTFEAMAEVLRGGLSLSLSGFSFWAHDIGGFEGLPPPSLYKRWVQFGLLSSHSRLHGSSSFRVPWIYDDHPEFGGKKEGDECSRVLREMTLLKLSLMPYLLGAALEASKSGTPVLRPLLMEFGERDRNVWSVDTQYMLGGDLLVCPIFSDDGEVTFYVPRTTSTKGGKGKAKWRSWFDYGKVYEEGEWYTETHGYDTLPLLLRPGAVVPVAKGLDTLDGDWKGKMRLFVNGPVDGGDMKVPIVLAGDVGKVKGEITVKDGFDGKGVYVEGAEELGLGEIETVMMHA